MAYEIFEDATLRRVFAVTLNAAQADVNASPPILHLEELSQELHSEAAPPVESNAPLLLSRDNAERALMARLSSPPVTYPQWPVHYLLGCYTRAVEETRSAGMLKSPEDQQRFIDTLSLIRQLTVSYAGFTVSLGMFPQPDEAEKRGALQLLDSLYAAAPSTGIDLPGQAPLPLIPEAVRAATGVVPMPASFLDEFSARFADEGLDEMLETIVRSLMVRLSSISVLGNYAAPLSVLERLVSSRPTATALVRLPLWLPQPDADGRAIEFQTVLGPAFGISAIPDIAAPPLTPLPGARAPDVAQHCFPAAEAGRAADLRSAVASIHAALGQLHSQLHRVFMSLLRNPDAREAAMNWITAAMRTNVERTKMRPDVKKAATDGFMLNIAAVSLKLCEPFMDPLVGKAWGRLDARYPSDPSARASYSLEDTRLGATSEEVEAWISGKGDKGDKAADGGGGKEENGAIKYHFICEAFFMTASALRLGLSKTLENCQNVARTGRNYLEDAESPANRVQATALRRVGERFKSLAVCLEVSLKQEGLLSDVLSYYRLLAAYMLRLACPTAAAGGPPTLPLPEPASMEFSSLPEFFVEDLCGALSWAGRARPDLVTGQNMEQYMLFFTVFLGSPAHVKNPYLRGRMLEALHSYMPPAEEEDAGSGWGSRRGRGGFGHAADEVATLFEVHPLVIGHMVRSLIGLYVDIERTDRHNAFYEKFNTRYQIGEVMANLWRMPQHREAWRAVASGDPRMYLRFVNMMINDSQHLLQEALEALPAVQEIERLQSDPAAWAALPAAQRAEHEESLDSHRRHLQSDFALAAIYLRTMRFTSEDAAVAARFFDVQVRDRQARILNFFLRYLTLPAERRRLKLRDPERYGWKPRELIGQLAAIHVNLYRADRTAWAAAVAADTDYYGASPEIFSELAGVLRTLGLASELDIADLEALARDAAAAAAGATAEEEHFEDVPEEFEDPLSCRLMTDPVRLPSGTVLDRGTILQHLLTDNRDPFSRAPVTEDDLIEEPELKAKIVAWVAGQRARQKQGGGGIGGGSGEAMEEG